MFRYSKTKNEKLERGRRLFSLNHVFYRMISRCSLEIWEMYWIGISDSCRTDTIQFRKHLSSFDRRGSKVDNTWLSHRMSYLSELFQLTPRSRADFYRQCWWSFQIRVSFTGSFEKNNENAQTIDGSIKSYPVSNQSVDRILVIFRLAGDECHDHFK